MKLVKMIKTGVTEMMKLAKMKLAKMKLAKMKLVEIMHDGTG